MKRFAATVTLLAAVACQGSDLTGRALSNLQAQTERIRAAAVARDPDAARDEIAALERAVSGYEAVGAIDANRASAILAAARAVAMHLALLEPPQPAEEPSVEESPEGDKDDRKGRGKGNGKDGGDGGDGGD